MGRERGIGRRLSRAAVVVVVASSGAAISTSFCAVPASALPSSDGGVDSGYLIAREIKVSGSGGVIATMPCEVEQEYEGSNNEPDAGPRFVVLRSLPGGGRPHARVILRLFGTPVVGVQGMYQAIAIFAPKPGVEWKTDTTSPRALGSISITLTSVRDVRVDGGKVFHEIHGTIEALAEATEGTASGTVDLRATF